ncbi:serine-rich adhesin for platelets-like isoform X2 [Ptychodera flava]|uniref:serine-rich adhesin for platelets-like isoform X2 n=1 Tax=Ptychodera flava TaxID=63121 RepID=UPI003969FBB3
MARLYLSSLGLFLAISILTFVFVEGDVPTNVEYACPNLNCTVTWDPPADTSDNDTIFYTTVHQACNKWSTSPLKKIPECTNTTERNCNLGNDIEPHTQWCVHVGSHSKEEGLSISPTPQLFFTASNSATLGAAEIIHISTTSRSISLRWLSPLTPYYHSNGTQKRMTYYYTIYYNITYCNPSNSHSCVTVNRDSAQFADLSDGIIPWTKYEIVLQGRMQQRKEYGDPVRVTVKTDEEAPERGVTLSEDGQSHDCDYSPNKRRIYILWEKPEEKYWHGELHKYEVHFWYQETESNLPASNVTVIERNINDTSMVIRDISRWKAVTIDVYTCNSAGCTASERPIQIEAVDVARDEPRSVSAYETSSSSFNVTWERPENDECIMSYNVRYTSDLHQNETEVTELYAHIVDVPGGTEYSVSVSANIYNGYDSTDEGEPRSTTVRLINEKNQTLTIVTAVLTCLMILGLIAICYLIRKYRVSIKQSCCTYVGEMEFRDHMDIVLDDRPHTPHYDESFDYDALNATLISISTSSMNGSISGTSVTETPSSSDSNLQTQNSAHPSAIIINGALQNVPPLSLDDILESPPTPDDNSGSTDAEHIGDYLQVGTSDSQRSTTDQSSNEVDSYARLGVGSTGTGSSYVGGERQQAESSSDNTHRGSQQKLGEPEDWEDGSQIVELQLVLPSSDMNNNNEGETGPPLQDIIEMPYRVGMVENKFSVIPNLEETISVNSCNLDSNQLLSVKNEENDGLNSAEISEIHQDSDPQMFADIERLLYEQDSSSEIGGIDNSAVVSDNNNTSSESNTTSSSGTDISDYVQSQVPTTMATDSNPNDSGYRPNTNTNKETLPIDNTVDLSSIPDVPSEDNVSEDQQIEPQSFETMDTDQQDSDNLSNLETDYHCQLNHTSDSNYVAQSNPTPDSNYITQSNEMPDSNYITQSNLTPDSNYIAQPNPTSDSNYVAQSNPTSDSDYVAESNPTSDSDYVDQSNPTSDSNYVAQSNPTSDSNYVAQSNPTSDSNYVAQSNPTSDSNYVANREAINVNSTGELYGDHTQQSNELSPTTAPSNSVPELSTSDRHSYTPHRDSQNHNSFQRQKRTPAGHESTTSAVTENGVLANSDDGHESLSDNSNDSAIGSSGENDCISYTSNSSTGGSATSSSSTSLLLPSDNLTALRGAVMQQETLSP